MMKNKDCFADLARKSLFAGWLAGCSSTPAREARRRKIDVFPGEYLDFLWKSKENSTPAREARRRKIGYPLVNTSISFENQRETTLRRAKRAGEKNGGGHEDW